MNGHRQIWLILFAVLPGVPLGVLVRVTATTAHTGRGAQGAAHKVVAIFDLRYCNWSTMTLHKTQPDLCKTCLVSSFRISKIALCENRCYHQGEDVGRGIFSAGMRPGSFLPRLLKQRCYSCGTQRNEWRLELRWAAAPGARGGGSSAVTRGSSALSPARPVGLLRHLAATACLVRLSGEGNKTTRSSFLCCFVHAAWSSGGWRGWGSCSRALSEGWWVCGSSAGRPLQRVFGYRLLCGGQQANLSVLAQDKLF